MSGQALCPMCGNDVPTETPHPCDGGPAVLTEVYGGCLWVPELTATEIARNALLEVGRGDLAEILKPNRAGWPRIGDVVLQTNEADYLTIYRACTAAHVGLKSEGWYTMTDKEALDFRARVASRKIAELVRMVAQ